MEKFIHRKNLAHFKRRLAEPRDEPQRPVLLKLLADQEAQGSPRPPRSGS
jgi:hypothetical protein